MDAGKGSSQDVMQTSTRIFGLLACLSMVTFGCRTDRQYGERLGKSRTELISRLVVDANGWSQARTISNLQAIDECERGQHGGWLVIGSAIALHSTNATCLIVDWIGVRPVVHAIVCCAGGTATVGRLEFSDSNCVRNLTYAQNGAISTALFNWGTTNTPSFMAKPDLLVSVVSEDARGSAPAFVHHYGVGAQSERRSRQGASGEARKIAAPDR